MIGPREKRRYHVRFGGLAYIAVAVLIGLAAVNSQTNLLFWTFGLMLSGLIVSGVVSGFMLLNLRVRRLLPDNGGVDEPLTVHYELTNRKRVLPCFSLMIEELAENDCLRGRPHAYCLHVGPGATGRADTVAWPRRRGEVRLGAIRVSTTFPFGIVRKSVMIEQPDSTIIYPRIRRLDGSLMARLRSADHDGERATQEAGGGEEFVGLREYRPGDSMRFIHWRHTARTGKLVSREMTRLSPPRLMVMLDVRGRRDGEEEAERAISFAASLVHEAHRRNEEVGLAVAGAVCGAFVPDHSKWHKMRMLRSLGELKLEGIADEKAAAPRVREARWVVIHADAIDESLGPVRAVHLAGAELERYCVTEEPLAAIASAGVNRDANGEAADEASAGADGSLREEAAAR